MKTKSIVVFDFYGNKELFTVTDREISSIDEKNKNDCEDKIWIFKENTELVCDYEITDISFVGFYKEITQFIGYINQYKATRTVSQKVKIYIRF